MRRWDEPRTPQEIAADLDLVWDEWVRQRREERRGAPEHSPPMSKLTSEMSPTERALLPFSYEHLPPALREVSRPICELAHEMTRILPPGPDLTAGLRKLREAKDCFVTSRVDAMRDQRILDEREAGK